MSSRTVDGETFVMFMIVAWAIGMATHWGALHIRDAIWRRNQRKAQAELDWIEEQRALVRQFVENALAEPDAPGDRPQDE